VTLIPDSIGEVADAELVANKKGTPIPFGVPFVFLKAAKARLAMRNHKPRFFPDYSRDLLVEIGQCKRNLPMLFPG
jgi:hypothetical protein